MKIGSSGEIGTGKDAKGVAGMTGKKKTGPAGTIPKDPELAALDDYEAWQRTAFEAAYFADDTGWLRSRLAQLDDEGIGWATDGLRGRRIRSERWAIERILRGRTEG